MYELYDETNGDGVNVRVRGWDDGQVSLDVRTLNGETGKVVNRLTLRWF